MLEIETTRDIYKDIISKTSYKCLMFELLLL